ncbi:uncharacterized protein DS421_19g657560 [Arachis hypogaea]|uniref:Uncharacterized protein n=1 Tax=Arachis hypogaea TaxID=3818 RepID=A0A6B9V9D2_ARAHY|nr:uncharacterized protein DS421_19g657560 [Arachis hypogaea]
MKPQGLHPSSRKPNAVFPFTFSKFTKPETHSSTHGSFSCSVEEGNRIRKKGRFESEGFATSGRRRQSGDPALLPLPRNAFTADFAGLGLLRSPFAVMPVGVAPSAISLAVLLSVKSVPLLLSPNQTEEEGDSFAASPRRTAAREEPGCHCISRRRGESPEKRERSHNVEGERCGPVARAGTRPTARSYRRRFCRRQASVSITGAFARFCRWGTLLPSPENLTAVIGELFRAVYAATKMCGAVL